MYVFCVSMFKFGKVMLHYTIVVSFEKLKFDYNQTWDKDVIRVPSYVNEVKGQVPRSSYI